MQVDHLASIKAFYAQNVFPLLGSPVGCDASEIAELESDLGFTIPLAYRQYLSWMGRDHDGIFVGCDWFLKNVRPNTEFLPGLLAENEVVWELPTYFLVFMGHQGYIAAYFELPAVDEDPPVFLYSECNESNVVTREGTFTEFLLRDLSGMAACLVKGKNTGA